MKQTLAYYITLLRKDFTSYCNEQLANLELSQGLLFFIIYVGNHPGCSPKELSLALHMDTGHVTRSLKKLEQGGFIFQDCNKEDRRARVLNLLEKGENAFRISHELFAQWDEEIFQGLSDGDRVLLLAQLEQLAFKRKGNDCVRNNL